MKNIFKKPESLKDNPFTFCPGCHHGIIHRLVAEAIDALNIREKTIGVASVGCSVFMYDIFDVDVIEAPHGRAPAVATGIKRALPDRVVFSIQGDGDLAAIGTSEIVHAAGRGENITIIFLNNGVYGMTGGQMAPTTPLGRVTTTSPYGRTHTREGYPLKICEMLNALEGPAFIARTTVYNPPNLYKAKKIIKRAFEVQIERLGFSLVEVLCVCPTNWRVSPLKACEVLENEVIPYYPLGVFREKTKKDII